MKKKKIWIVLSIIITVALILLFIPKISEKQKAYLQKMDLFKTKVVTDETVKVIGDTPVDPLGNVVFLSACDGSSRAKVYYSSGKTLSDAWDNTVELAMKDLDNNSMNPRWIRIDIIYNNRIVSRETVINEVSNAMSGFDFYGIALDPQFETAILEGELNGRGIYDYKANKINMEKLNEWLKGRGKNTLNELPDHLTVFESLGWICDENNSVFKLCNDGADTGRREITILDADYAKMLIDSASSYLMNQLKPEGKFIYGFYPQYNEEINNYNILRHSGTIWSLICRYRMFPDEKLKEMIECAIEYMISQIRFDHDGIAYLHEAKDYEFKLGGNGLAVVSLTEYMNVFQNDKYREQSVLLGEGILKQQNPEDGSYWHILNNDFSRGEDFRTIYYDGECTFALARLYSLTGDQKWLDAACKAIDHFIDKDYTQYRDHWVAYSLNEVTKYVDRQEYWDFALANATNNFKRIMGRSRTYPTNLELLISSFETWQRMVDKGIDTGDFNVKELLNVISARANRQLSGYFYPELAMYMENPQRILGSFMMRDDKFRVRIDDVQHNIGGFYLYWRNYDAMLAAGLDPNRTDGTR